MVALGIVLAALALAVGVPALAGLIVGIAEVRTARVPQMAPPRRPRALVLDGWNQIYLHHALDGADLLTALRRADRWADHDLGGDHYDVSCDERLSEDLRARLAAALAQETVAPQRVRASDHTR